LNERRTTPARNAKQDGTTGMIVSVLIDTYNHEQFIERAITSVLEQDMPMDAIEILVVDDGSTDCTPEIVRRFEPRVRLLRKSNGGQASAFNLGFAHASGQIIAMLDGDDWWEKPKLRLVLEAFRENPGIGAIGNALNEVAADGKHLRAISPDLPHPFSFRTLQEGIQFRSLMTYMGTSRLALRRSVLERVLPVPEDLVIEADEYLATLSVAISGGLVLGQPLTNYRYHPGSLYQYGMFSLEKARRKFKVLQCLVRELPGRLHALGVSPEIVAAMLQPRKVEAERLRLTVEGGMSWETFRAEREASRVTYKDFSLGYRLFRVMVLSLTLTMPPKWFYRVRNWYSDRNLHRLREILGKPTLADTFVQRKAGP
jgi:glycosyltransferase involved in cell wall biosynthesis